MNSKQCMDIYNKYFMQLYNPVDFIPVSGHGSRLLDVDGRDLIDFSGGVAVTALGQTNKILVDALVEQAHKLWHVGNIFTNLPQIELAQKLVDNSCADKVFLCNTGAESVEAALKLARRYATKTYGPQKHKIVSFLQSYHGRSLFTVSTGGQAKYWDGFYPLPPGIFHAKFNDIESVRELVDDDVAAVIIETIQAEAGVMLIERDFLYELRKICDAKKVALIIDEVQTGMGRTGHLLSYMDYGIEPDIICMAKALGGGFPIGAMLAKEPFAGAFQMGTHGATFGGNPLAAAVACKSFEIINTPEFLANVKKQSEVFFAELHKINQEVDIYCDLRGKGLLIGAELKDEYKGRAFEIVHLAAKHGVSVLMASPNVTRFLPSLIIPLADIKEGMQRLKKALFAFKTAAE